MISVNTWAFYLKILTDFKLRLTGPDRQFADGIFKDISYNLQSRSHDRVIPQKKGHKKKLAEKNFDTRMLYKSTWQWDSYSPYSPKPPT